jgi:Tfp pilus assembly protein PilN
VSQQINLFNPAFAQQKRVFAAATMAQALALLLVGVIALGLYGSARVGALERDQQALAGQLAKKQARLASVAAEFPPRQPSPALQAELQDAEARLATLRKISGVLEHGELGDTHGYAEYFRALAREHVEGVWLTAVSVGGAGNAIGVRGRSLDPALLPGYLGQLTHQKALQGKAFGSLQISQPAAGAKDDAAPFVEFSLQSGTEGAQP